MSAKPKKKRGRPSTLTPELEVELLKLVRQGDNFREAARKLKINWGTVWERRATDPEYDERCSRAARLGTEANLEAAEGRLKKSTNKRISVDRELAHHYRWKAGKLLSAFKDKLTIDGAVDVKGGAKRPVMRVLDIFMNLDRPLREVTDDGERLEAAKRLNWFLAQMREDLLDAGYAKCAHVLDLAKDALWVGLVKGENHPDVAPVAALPEHIEPPIRARGGIEQDPVVQAAGADAEDILRLQRAREIELNPRADLDRHATLASYAGSSHRVPTVVSSRGRRGE